MRKSRPWLYIFLPVLYIGIVFGLVVFQFSKKSDSFSQSLGDLTVSGKTSEDGAPVDLSLKGRGLEFKFSAVKTLLLAAPDGTQQKYRPTQWAWKDGNLVVKFQGGIVLTFQKTGPGGNILLLQPTLPAELAAAASTLRIPFSAEGGGRLDSDPVHPVAVISKGNQKFLATLDGVKDQIDSDSSFVLGIRGGQVRPVRLELLPEGSDPLRQWLAQAVDSGTVAAARDALTQYTDKAWRAWGDTRFRPGAGGWLTSDGATRFSSRLVGAWAREALVRGSYSGVISRVQSLLSDDPSTWNFDALPYLGNLMEVTQAWRRTVEDAVSHSTVDWAGQPRLWLDALYYGPEGSAARIQKLLVSGDLPAKTSDLVGFLANLLVLKAKTAQGDAPDAALEPRISNVLTSLISRIVRQESDLYITAGEGYLDLKSGLLLGRMLLDQTANLQSDQWQAIGSQLILTSLRHQDPLTKIPEIVVVAPGQDDRQEGGFYPEEVYAGVLGPTDSETPLGEGYPANAFVKSPLPLVGKTVTSGQLRFNFRFPSGSAEFIVVSGIPPFDNIMLHGIRWRTDPQFQSYTDGWYYSASTKTLYVKIKHREDQEELVVNIKPDN